MPIMQVQGPTSLLQMLLATQARRTATAVFAPETAAPSPPAPPAVATPAQSVQMLVALAAAMPEPERRRRLARQAEKALDALEMLQAALIVGVGATAPARELKDWSEGRTRPEDPELAGIMDEIDLRIQVELAKLERE